MNASTTSAAFGETLQFITNVKLEELEKRRVGFEKHAEELLAKAKKYDNNPAEKLSLLLEGLRAWPGSWTSESDLSVKNVEQFVNQAKNDPSIPHSLLNGWVNKLESQIHHETLRYDYAKLFGNLVTEWITSEDRGLGGALHPVNASEGRGSPDAFEKVNRTETMEQKEKLESLIFESKEIDVPALEEYLKDLFSSKDAEDELKKMRKRIKKFSEDLREKKITTDDMKWIIKSLLATDLLSDAKQVTLKEFGQNPTVVKELASVLNMQLASLSTWHWPKDGVVVEPRRHLNGKTRFFLDSEILTSLLLQYLGVKWSIEFRLALNDISTSRAWKELPKSLDKNKLARRWHFLDDPETIPNIHKTHTEFHLERYFMSQLHSSVDSTGSYNDYDEEKERGIGGRRGGRGGRRGGRSGHSTTKAIDNPVDLKQSLLHLLSADILLNKTLSGKCTVFRTDLEWFGPSLPFQSILTVLKFFGMPESDLQFINAFLACPLRFKGDPADSPVRTRKRGIPISHALSTMCGELVLFVMDFAVNQKTDGLFLYRIHDDFWFWDANGKRCVSAWEALEQYAALTGMQFNAGKTGSVHVGDGELPVGLPLGDVRWGFLRLDADGKFVIDQAMVDDHIVELRRQLAATSSIFSWTQAYNKYMAFFVRNCGSPAKVFSRAHIDDIVTTIVKIQKALFPETSGSFIGTLASRLEDKFGMRDIPPGYYFWPVAAGGLDVRDPLVELLAMRKDLPTNPTTFFDDAMREERQEYDNKLDAWESGKTSRIRYGPYSDLAPSRSEHFFTFKEYILGRTERSMAWSNAFDKLLERPVLHHVVETSALQAAFESLGDGVEAFGTTDAEGWYGLSPYWKWVISLHHDQMLSKFGSLAMVEPWSIPVGMVGVFKSSRMRWEQ
ncbi:reverse transcriptase-like protein [Rickenella mellea]|uniref:Reverse transcriptase-like protein n=1 Tax=Rickenella mellea TaxID=50990 RepID=A0A4Y7QHA8_9AGAM|nr:reverse transcriptase-like protein [Rickenella mellea]